MWKLLPVALSLSLLAPLPGGWTPAPAYANTTVREVCPPCNQAIALHPQEAWPYIERGQAHAAAGHFEQALADYQRALELATDKHPIFTNMAYCYRADLYLSLQAYDQALADYTAFITRNPDSSVAYQRRGDAYYKMGNDTRALADYGQALVFNPEDAEVYLQRGHLYARRQQYAQAIADYTQAIDLQRDEVGMTISAYYGSEENTDSFEHIDKLLADYEALMHFEPEHALAYISRGVVYGHMQRTDQAMADLNSALRLNPQATAAYYERGALSHRLKRYPAAESDYRQALALAPREARAYGGLGMLLLETGKPEQALGLVNQGLQLEPEARWMQEIQVIALALNHQYPKAEEVLASLLKGSPETAAKLLEDLADLKGMGIAHPNLEKLRERLEEQKRP